ncbi:hypothetical protein CNY89_29605, partial [Amaricoccus sp. HAR-UPW-R2A-40]
ALAALLVDGMIHPDVADDLRGVIAEALPRVSRDNPDMTALSIAALAALLVDGMIHPDVADDLRGVIAEALPRVSR